MRSPSPARTPQLAAEQPLTGGCWIPPKKRYPTSKGKGEAPNKMVGGVKSHLESNPIPSRDAWRPQAEPCVYQDPEIPQRLSKTCL